MATLAIRKTAWQGLSQRDKKIIRWVADLLQLGSTPPLYVTPGGVEWFVFDDWRFKGVHIAYFGCVIANLSDVPAGYTFPQKNVRDFDGNVIGTVDDRRQMRRDVRAFCENPARTKPLVLPRDIVFTFGGNHWQEILDAQGAPRGAVRMASGVPASWTPVEVGGP